ncbi:MAG: thioredoxin domain-containing protein [Desulfobulbaceae bacterium]|nr:thioredoxin domain-containing protein [Desulfobulbaceae bacterium]
MKQIASLALVFIVSTWGYAEPIDELVNRRLAMGEKPNRLVKEKSPYLLQHAFNPVDWYPWGDEAFAKAKAENKPIFLSVGYSTCHWCHVMEEESFESARISAILNRWFVSIKVDREERPDVDQVYMSATQAMTGSGGWPMSVFLFPDGKPFYAGSYFPPQAMYGRPGFADLLMGIQEAWENKRGDLHDVAARLAGELEKRSKSTGDGKFEKDIMDRAYREFAKNYDSTYGGFSQAPKFPRPVQFNFLLQYWHRTGNEQARDMTLQTLQFMAKGGIRDHLGGGFHRYATDTRWQVPHFEKMLYDQAQLANTYLDAYIITGEEKYSSVAEQIFNYVLRDMTSPQGAFYSAEDADSEDPYNPGKRSEGAFFLWTGKEIERLLPQEDAAIFHFRFGIQENGNVPEDPHGEFKGRNILSIAHSIADTAKKFNKNEELIAASLEKSMALLLSVRSARKRPHLDDKVLVAWNGIMIGALARGAVILKDHRLLEAAEKAALFIQNQLYDVHEKHLWRRYRDGESAIAGQLDDYAFLVGGLIELYQASQQSRWLEWAVALTDKQIELFWDKEQGGFFDSIGDSLLPFRMKADYDGAEPAGNSVAAQNLLQLGAITLNDDYTAKGKITTTLFSSVVQTHPMIMPRMLCSLDQAQSKPQQVIIAGKPERHDTRELLTTVFASYEPGRVVLLADDGPNEDYLAKHLPFIEDMGMIDDRSTAYVCKDFTCQMPVNDVEELKLQLQGSMPETPLE